MNTDQIAEEAANALCHDDPVGNLPFNTAIIKSAIEKARKDFRCPQCWLCAALEAESRAAHASDVWILRNIEGKEIDRGSKQDMAEKREVLCGLNQRDDYKIERAAHTSECESKERKIKRIASDFSKLKGFKRK